MEHEPQPISGESENNGGENYNIWQEMANSVPPFEVRNVNSSDGLGDSVNPDGSIDSANPNSFDRPDGSENLGNSGNSGNSSNKDIIQESFEHFSGDILDVTVRGSRVAFSSIDSFNPTVLKQDKPSQLSPEIRKVLRVKTDIARTLDHTHEDAKWSSKIFGIVENAMSNPDLQKMLETEGIQDLRHLSPRQAVVLTTDLVAMTTKFNREAARAADNKTAMELLQDGLEHYSDPNWEGNGVCRNFASMTQAVFDSLKAHQEQPSQLNDTYCVLRASHNRKDYDATAAQQEGETHGRSHGHAWNDFIQVGHEGQSAAVTSLDVTWGKFDLDTRQIIGMEQTAQRTSAIIDALTEDDNTRLGREEVNQLMGYYGGALNQQTQTAADKDRGENRVADGNKQEGGDENRHNDGNTNQDESEDDSEETAQLCSHQIVKVLEKADSRSAAITDNVSILTEVATRFVDGRVTDYFGAKELETLYQMYPRSSEARDALIDSFIVRNYPACNQPDFLRQAVNPGLQADYKKRLALYNKQHKL